MRWLITPLVVAFTSTILAGQPHRWPQFRTFPHFLFPRQPFTARIPIQFSTNTTQRKRVVLFASFWMGLLQAIIFLVGIVLIGLVLIQRGRGGGLVGALGGQGGSSPFGSRAGDMFTRVTLVLAVAWIVLNMMMGCGVAPAPVKPQGPAATEAPAPTNQ